MKKSSIVLAIAAAMSFTAGTAYAEDAATTMKMDGKNHANDEKCVVMKDGKNLVKAGKADCGTGDPNSCSGKNKEGDAKAWIFVPKGQCEKINAGDMSGVSQEIKDKIESGSDDSSKKM